MAASKLDRGNTSVVKEFLLMLREVLETRLIGPTNVVRAAQSKLQRGSIVLSSGMDAIRTGPDSTIAAASTDGVVGRTRALALDLALIRCNCIMLGLIDTPLLGGVPNFRRFAELYEDKLPVRRLGKAEDMAEGVIILMKKGSVTVATLNIYDGGPLV